MNHDVAVLGGGPVGLGCAIAAARAGLSCVVLEPRDGPVDKACGEGLMPSGVQALADLGVEPTGHPIRGIRYLDGARSRAVDFGSGPGLGVRRTTLHETLTAAVERAGVEVMAARAADLDQSDSDVRIGTTLAHGRVGPPVRARFLLAADGLHSPTRRSLGLDRPVHARRRFGQRRHHAVAPWAEHVEVHWAPLGEAYVTPVAPGLVGVAVLSREQGAFDDLLAWFPQLQERLAGASPASTVRGAGSLRQRSSRRVAGRVLLVGDAAGYVDALTGEGISVGLAQARAAVAAVSRQAPSAYERGWRRATWRADALTHGLLRATSPAWARRALVPAADRAPWLFAAAVNELGGRR